jgi:glutaminyl-peptide cyclotransferase
MIASFAYLSLLWLLHAVCQVAAYKQLSNNSLASIPSPGKDFDIRTGPILAPILTVRVSGTNGNDKVRHHFVNYFRKNLPKWELSWENSTQPTALQKNIKFANLIFRRDPPWAKKGDVGRLVLAAHYDSKMEPKGFIGAVDSAAPCAMMIHAARSIDQALTRKWEAMQKNGQAGLGAEKGVELYLLDGEEAFKMWSDSDSIYGARLVAILYNDEEFVKANGRL